MSCSSYCQGLQSCLEPSRLVEPCVLRLKLAPSKSNISSPVPRKSESNNTVDMGGWSFLQNLTKNASETNKESLESDKTYVPPNFKRSASMLSEKSLEMCTESLGSETGSDGGDSGDEMALLSSNNKNANNETKLSKLKQTRRMSLSSSFPPPLTSISGSNTFQVRKHREHGRLVMEAVSISSSKACFHAERVNGRLKLHLMKGRSNNEEEEEEEEEETEETFFDEENEGEEVVNEEEEEEDLEENNGNEGVEMGMDKLARPSRCKESGNGSKNLLNWKQFLVTI